MTGFIAKPIITSQTIGERLSKVRQAQGLALPQVARACAIKVEYLSAIEQGHYGDLPGDLYAREFIKTYARFLSVNPKEAAAEYFLETQGNSAAPRQGFGRRAHSCFHLPGCLNNFWPRRFGWRLAASAFAAAGAAVYLFLLRPQPSWSGISVSSPGRNYLAADGRIVLAGQAARAVALSVNDAPVALDQQGFFRENLSLPPGLTVLKIEALYRAGRKSVVWRAVAVPTDENVRKAPPIEAPVAEPDKML